MFERARFQIDAAVAINKGKREFQEDAVLADFAIGSRLGIVVLADGMGGHNAGDVASTLVTTEVFRELRYTTRFMLRDPASIPGRLLSAAQKVNGYLKRYISENPNCEGMGCTLVIAVQTGKDLFWLSVGDSPVFLLRDGKMTRLNEEHSLAPQIDYLAQQGVLTPEQARTHPDRSVLTSAINGQEIRYVDCSDAPFSLKNGDALIVASDGLCSLKPSEIARVIRENADRTCAKASEKVLSAIRMADCPDQDNVCFALMKVSDERADEQMRINEIRAANALPLMADNGATEAQPKKPMRQLTRILRAVSRTPNP
ncbi:Protein serine/threonine phosphatase PrpC [Candidatus Rhodobacter oscarellae]|uniref:Protein serine/threonine phosphatase PrpC n=1 Tax=Candidatus Rhodobacter oscarellae TaxID=1675527 RepID=A0A0J9GYY4_9RHOB|nr:protein phosphatase 2C domain-containing protein [Candidatus Rhodobacter lobularis]KMW58673.1 Protein serine/threonine phosphatase PrpC [Candidatus Rhodobacter lobularis]